ncbi:MAG: c-type cytochrome [Gemmatimonadales bacterium]
MTAARAAGLLWLGLAGCTVQRAVPPAVDTTVAKAGALAPLPPLPKGDLGVAILRGRAILGATRDSLPTHVGNGLRCTSCHLDEGRRPNAMPWIGVTGRFPQYRSRSASVQRLEDRINDCFERSLAGTALAWDDPAMRDMVAYMAWLSTGVPQGGTVPGQGLPLGSPERGDTAHGAAIFVRECARCHGSNGEGMAAFPPLWGPRSFTIGAGMARLRTLAAFAKHNMPFDRAGTLSDQDAQDVATFITTKPRPPFAASIDDWPRGDAPPDVAYPTKATKTRSP